MEKEGIRKYLLYSAGEIILVIAGILIALQVNNWNDSRKLRLEALALLNNLEKDLRLDSTILSMQYSAEKSIMLTSSERLFGLHLNGRIPGVPDSLIALAFRYATFTPTVNFTTNTFSRLVATDLIDRLKIPDLIDLLDAYYNRIEFFDGYVSISAPIAHELFLQLANYYRVIPQGSPERDSLRYAMAGVGETEFTTEFDLLEFRSDNSLNPLLYDMIDIHQDRLGILEEIIGLNGEILAKLRE